jgi:hypothetical protein
MIDAMQGMSGPISGRQRAIVAVLRAGAEASIVRVSIIGLLRAFKRYPRGYYTLRQLMHSRPVLCPLRPLIDTRRHCARRQPGPIGENALLMTLCPPNIILNYILLCDNIPLDNLSWDNILKYILHSEKNVYFFMHTHARPPLPKNLDPRFFSWPIWLFSIE